MGNSDLSDMLANTISQSVTYIVMFTTIFFMEHKFLILIKCLFLEIISNTFVGEAVQPFAQSDQRCLSEAFSLSREATEYGKSGR